MRPRSFAPLLPMLAAATLAGQAPVSPAADAAQRTARVGRVAEAAAPRIDGRMDDACWADAPAIGDLVMVEPWEGRAPTQRTVVKLLHDRGSLYLGLWCHDDDPAQIVASMRARDARLDPDDRVEILLDPFENRRTAYFFQIGAGGSIGDILISADGGKFDKPWDAVWQGASTVTGEGWFAEIAIPFRSIPRREGAGAWGFNLRRYVRTRNEDYQWANAVQAVSFYRPSQCGTIEGFGEIDGGIGLELMPYAAVSAARDRRARDDGWHDDFEGGGEAYYRLLPSLTIATTLFTDFAETEDDGRQINLNRFPLFFPEKRDFFLDGIGYFTFGSSDAGGTTFHPFFTRRIGLARDGTPIPLLGGVKVTGEVGPLELGLLDVEVDATDALAGENLAVARMKYALGEQTTVGLIGTHGDPGSRGDNAVLGVDAYHREPGFVGDMDLQVAVDAVASTGTAGDDDGSSFGGKVTSRGREWDWSAGVRWVSDDFEPAIGFVRRRGSRASAVQVGYQPRLPPGALGARNLEFRVGLEREEAWAGATQEVAFAVEKCGVDMHSGDTFYLHARRSFERIGDDFTLFGGTTSVAAGDYWMTRGGLAIQTTEGRPWNVQLNAETGDFFAGTSHVFDAQGEWRLTPLWHLGGGYGSAIVDLGPGQSFTTQVASGRLDLHFTPALSLRNLVQFDNESDLLGWQSRLRWIYAPGRDLFAVLGTRWIREDDGSLVSGDQAIELKIVHGLRF
jgi:hypothetical protein